MLTNKLIDKFYEDVEAMSLKFPVAELHKATGFSKGTISQYLSKKLPPSENFIKAFNKSFEKVLKKFPRETVVQEPESEYLAKRRELKNNGRPAIPIYEATPATLSNIESYRDSKEDNPDFWISIPNLRDCNYGTRAKGDSMHPIIRTNALVIGREIVDLRVVVFGEIYIIHTKNGIETVKYIHPHDNDPDVVLLVPYNQKAKTTPIHKSDILKLYEAKAVFNSL